MTVAIMHKGASVQGLTTAAMIWVNAAVGMAAGSGHLRLAAVVTVIVLIAMVGLTPLDRVLEKRQRAHDAARGDSPS